MNFQEADEIEPLPAWAGRAHQDGELSSTVGESAFPIEPAYVVDGDRSSSRRVFFVLLAVIVLSAAAGVLAGLAFISV